MGTTCNAGDPRSVPGWGMFPAEGNGYHASTLPWRIPQTEALGGLQWGSKEVDKTKQLPYFSRREIYCRVIVPNIHHFLSLSLMWFK